MDFPYPRLLGFLLFLFCCFMSSALSWFQDTPIIQSMVFVVILYYVQRALQRRSPHMPGIVHANRQQLGMPLKAANFIGCL